MPDTLNLSPCNAKNQTSRKRHFVFNTNNHKALLVSGKFYTNSRVTVGEENVDEHKLWKAPQQPSITGAL